MKKEEILARAEALEAMLTSKGWLYVQEYFDEQMEILKEELAFTANWEEIPEKRAKLKAFLEIKNMIKEWINEKERVLKEQSNE